MIVCKEGQWQVEAINGGVFQPISDDVTNLLDCMDLPCNPRDLPQAPWGGDFICNQSALPGNSTFPHTTACSLECPETGVNPKPEQVVYYCTYMLPGAPLGADILWPSSAPPNAIARFNAYLPSAVKYEPYAGSVPICEADFDLVCPFGKCEDCMACTQQQTILAAGFGGLAFCCICCCSIWCWRNWYTPMEGKVRLKGNEEVNWRIIEHDGNAPRGDETAPGPGGEKIHIIWDLDQRQVQKYSTHGREYEQSNSNLLMDEMSIDGTEVDLSGEKDFSLATTVTTSATEFFLAGKEGGDQTLGKNKALVILSGHLCWLVGEDRLEGSKLIDDGQQHDVEVRFRDQQYELLVDGQSDGAGLQGVPDAPGSSWVSGDEMENAFGEGELGHVLYNGQKVSEDLPRDGTISSVPTTNYKRDLAEADKQGAFVKGQRVEYFSATHKQWVAAVVDGTDRNCPQKDGHPTVNLRVGTKDQVRQGVPLSNVRLPFVSGEACSVYGCGEWYPASISGPVSSMATGKGYDVQFLDEAAADMDDETVQRFMQAAKIRRRFEKKQGVMVYHVDQERWVHGTVQTLPPRLDRATPAHGAATMAIRQGVFKKPERVLRTPAVESSTTTASVGQNSTAKSEQSWFGSSQRPEKIPEESVGLASVGTAKEDEVGDSGLPERWATVKVTLDDSEEQTEIEVPWYYLRSISMKRRS
jgi:hypothetical protein